MPDVSIDMLLIRFRPHTIEDQKHKIAKEIVAIPFETCRKSCYENFVLQQCSNDADGSHLFFTLTLNSNEY